MVESGRGFVLICSDSGIHMHNNMYKLSRVLIHGMPAKWCVVNSMELA
jgi:hypothetical protein